MEKPVVICIGTINVIGDSLGPKVGDLLIKKYDVDAYVYGKSDRPVNGKNYHKYVEHIKVHHKNSIVIAVDACLGDREDVGKVKYSIKGLKAGAALNKELSAVGDLGILGVVAERSDNNFSALVHADEDVLNATVEKTAQKVCSVLDQLRLNYISRHIIDKAR